ncbi:MAG TPA: YdeI/OmpD-associated family protein [Roseiarcus sp.]|nr:YdeI/OmpD-associated family protein [Roseiarcus sp.]
MKFRSIIQLNKINPYVLVSADRATRLKQGWRKPMPVLVQVNGEPNPPWRVNMMPVGDGSFYLYLHGAVRKASTTAVGDEVEISLSFDKSYRGGPIHEAPAEFAARLSAEPKAQAAWRKLPPSRQKEILRYLATLKSDAAKTRNVERAIRVLSGSKERFLARDWNAASSVPSR